MSIGKSIMVKCDMCDLWCRARGLHAHMRQKHGIIIKTVTKVVEPDLSRTIVAGGGDLGHLTKVIEQVTNSKKVELVPGNRGGKIMHHDHLGNEKDYDWWVKYWNNHPEEAVQEWSEIKRIIGYTGNVMCSTWPHYKWEALCHMCEHEYDNRILWHHKKNDNHKSIYPQI